MFRYAFRLHRWGMIGFGAVFALSTFIQGAAYTSIAGTSPASRALFARQMDALAGQLTYLLPLPHQVDTLAGYVGWRAWGTLPILAAIWVIASASGAVRGDEERLLVESWLASPVSRTRLVITRLAAFAAAAAVASGGGLLGTLAGAGRTESIGIDHLAGQAFALWVLAVALFSLCYLVAQIPRNKRAAQGAAAVLVLLLFILNAAARTAASLDGASWISPFHWYDASYPLPPDGHLDALGLALCAATAVVGGALSVVLFQIRDVGGPIIRVGLPERPASDSPPTPLLRWPVARLLYRQRGVLLIWILGVALMAVYMTAISKQVIDSLLLLPGMREYLTHGTADPVQGFISVFWFSMAQLLLSGFAIHMVSAWASDDTEGVLAAELSRPRRRWSIVLERGVTALTGIVLLAAIGSIVAALTAHDLGVRLDTSAVVRATLLLVPFALCFTAIGAVGSVWWPRASVGVLGGVVVLSYLIQDVGPLLKWPTWAIDLSPFSLYGSPLLNGVYWNGLYAMVAVVLAGFAAATYLMQRRELTE